MSTQSNAQSSNVVVVRVELPGVSVDEMMQRVTEPLERQLLKATGITHIHSATRPGMSLTEVHFGVEPGPQQRDEVTQLLSQAKAGFPAETGSIEVDLAAPRLQR